VAKPARSTTRRAFLEGVAGFVFLGAIGGADVHATPSRTSCEARAVVEALRRALPEKRARTLLIASTLTLRSDDGERVQELVEFHAEGGKVRLEYREPGRVAVTGYDGETAWRITKDGPVPGDPAHFVVLQRIRDILGLVELVAEKGAEVECAAGAPEGQQRILVARANGEMLQLDVETATGRLRRYQGESPGTGKADVIDVELDAWHEVEGHWVAFRVVTRINGKLFAEAMASHAKVDMPLPDAMFKRPDGVVGPHSRGL